MASTDVETIDTGWVRENPDAPSARFGWSGSAPRTLLVAAIVSALALLGMLVGNHVGHVEDIFLIGIAAVILIGAIVSYRKIASRWTVR